MRRKCPDCKSAPLGPAIAGFTPLRCLRCAEQWLADRIGQKGIDPE